MRFGYITYDFSQLDRKILLTQIARETAPQNETPSPTLACCAPDQNRHAMQANR